MSLVEISKSNRNTSSTGLGISGRNIRREKSVTSNVIEQLIQFSIFFLLCERKNTSIYGINFE